MVIRDDIDNVIKYKRGVLIQFQMDNLGDISDSEQLINSEKAINNNDDKKNM